MGFASDRCGPERPDDAQLDDLRRGLTNMSDAALATNCEIHRIAWEISEGRRTPWIAVTSRYRDHARKAAHNYGGTTHSIIDQIDVQGVPPSTPLNDWRRLIKTGQSFDALLRHRLPNLCHYIFAGASWPFQRGISMDAGAVVRTTEAIRRFQPNRLVTGLVDSTGGSRVHF
jgi:hypothetical protein